MMPSFPHPFLKVSVSRLFCFYTKLFIPQKPEYPAGWNSKTRVICLSWSPAGCHPHHCSARGKGTTLEAYSPDNWESPGVGGDWLVFLECLAEKAG